jgi:hypothetical protein
MGLLEGDTALITGAASGIGRDPDLEWIDFVRPVGLVVAPVLLKELGLAPSRQTQADSAVVAAPVADDSSKPGFNNPWAFFEEVLGWEAPHVAGSPVCRKNFMCGYRITTRR